MFVYGDDPEAVSRLLVIVQAFDDLNADQGIGVGVGTDGGGGAVGATGVK